MSFYYVTVSDMMTRSWRQQMTIWVEQSGAIDAEYHPGGWEDNVVAYVKPHLRFACEEDALTYVLTYGGECSATIPCLATTNTEDDIGA